MGVVWLLWNGPEVGMVMDCGFTFDCLPSWCGILGECEQGLLLTLEEVLW